MNLAISLNLHPNKKIMKFMTGFSSVHVRLHINLSQLFEKFDKKSLAKCFLLNFESIYIICLKKHRRKRNVLTKI